VFCRVAPANGHDAPFATPLLATAVALYALRPRVVRLDAAYWGRADRLDPYHPGCRGRHPI